MPWDSFRGTVSVVIPDPKASRVSLDDPLILFLSRNEAVLLTTRGFVIQTFPVELSAVPSADAEWPGRDRPLTYEDVEPLLKTLSPWLTSDGINLLSVDSKVVGGRDTGEVCVRVGIERKKRMSELGPNDFPIPPAVELHIQNPDGSIVSVGIPTDVVEIGELRTAQLDQRVRPAPSGYQIAVDSGIFGEATGTLGANIVYKGRLRLLTNNHVIAKNGNIGSNVYQPGWALWGNTLTTVEGFVPVTTYANRNQPNPVYNSEDLAWAAVDSKESDTTITMIGQPTGFRDPVVGESVCWVGKTTATVQRTTIKGIKSLAVIPSWGRTGEYAWFENVVTFNGGVAAEGDSGSVVVATTDMKIVAQIFAMNDAGDPYATRIL